MALPALRIGGAALLLLLAVGTARADELEPLAREAMKLSGTQAMLEGVGTLLETQSKNDPRMLKLAPPERARLLSTLKGVFDGRRMADDLTATLAGTQDRERLAAAVTRMRDPQYQKVTRGLVAETLKTTDQDVLAYAKRLEKNAPAPERIQLIQRLDEATDSVRILADIRYESIEAMLAGQAGQAGAEDRARLAAMREEIETQARNEYFLRTLHLTRKLDRATLETYVKAHENEPMGWLSRHLGYGIQRAIVKAAGEMARSLGAPASTPSPR